MTVVKTAISLEASLFDQINELAQELCVSRSKFFVLAAQEFISRHENKKLLDALNAAYDDLPTATEETLFDKVRDRHPVLVEGQW
jgi:metal-responsive CopG/Arc/MetJ family transcriptional regulator